MKTLRVADLLDRINLADIVDPAHPRLALGYDIATTTKRTSNPSALALAQEVRPTVFYRLVLRWKSADPAVARAILHGILDRIPHGLRVRGLAIDATSEKYFASDLRAELARRVPVHLIVSSEGIRHAGEDMIYKTYLGNQYVNDLEDGYAALPPEDFIGTDHRLVIKERGLFDAELGEDGAHADTFDACKLAKHVLSTGGGPAEAAAAPTGSLGDRKERADLSNSPLARLSRRFTGGGRWA